jgi:hypothetical protein
LSTADGGPKLTSPFSPTNSPEDPKFHGRTVVIRRSKTIPKKITAHLVFTKGLTTKQGVELIERCAGKPILLIGNSPGYAVSGACANFTIEKKKVRFEVNSEVAKKGKLSISSQLLKLARIVESKGEKK